MTHRGELYRSKAAALAIDNALEDFTGIHPREFDGFLESWVKDDQDMKAFNVIEEHGKAVNSIGGASAYRFPKWLDREEIKPTPNNMRDIWQSAQVEAVTWHSATDENKTTHHHIDMRAAYLACDRRDFRADSDSVSEIERYGSTSSASPRSTQHRSPWTAQRSPSPAPSSSPNGPSRKVVTRSPPGEWATTCANTRAGLPRQSCATCSRAAT